jgi:hypothetical protein
MALTIDFTNSNVATNTSVNAISYTTGATGTGTGGLVANATTLFIGNNTINAAINTTALYIGGNVIANSTGANNAFNLGGTAASSYQLNSTLAANVATLTANNANNLGGTAAASYQLNSTLAANVATLTANNASYLGGTAAASYQLNSTLSANVATMAANSSTYANSSVTNTFTVGTASYFVANGNFGVRTSTPIKPFSVLSSDNDPVIITNSSNTNWNRIYYQKGNRSWTMGQDNGTSFVLSDETAAAYRILVDLNGNVGIGTSSPGGKLDVEAGNTYFIVAPSTYTSATVGPRPAGDGTSSFILQANNTAGNKFDSSSSGLTVYVNNLANLHSVFASNGNFGIGTSSPSATLDVVGTVNTSKANILQQTLTDGATISWDTSLG